MFGINCAFGERVRFNKPKFKYIPDIVDRVIRIDDIGNSDSIYFYKTLQEIYVGSLHFFGTIEEFEQQVLQTHENAQYKREYIEAIKYIKAII